MPWRVGLWGQIVVTLLFALLKARASWWLPVLKKSQSMNQSIPTTELESSWTHMISDDADALLWNLSWPPVREDRDSRTWWWEVLAARHALCRSCRWLLMTNNSQQDKTNNTWVTEIHWYCYTLHTHIISFHIINYRIVIYHICHIT